MAAAINIIREICESDESGFSPVMVLATAEPEGPTLWIRQDADKVAMSLDHAEAVHAALGASIADAKARAI